MLVITELRRLWLRIVKSNSAIQNFVNFGKMNEKGNLPRVIGYFYDYTLFKFYGDFFIFSLAGFAGKRSVLSPFSTSWKIFETVRVK